MRINDTFPKALSIMLLSLSGIFFAYLAVASFGVFLKYLNPVSELGRAPWNVSLTVFGLVCLFVPIAGLLLSAAFFEYRKPKPELLWTAFGLIAGLCIGTFIAQLIMTYNSILWETIPEFMSERLWEAFYTSLLSLIVFSVWFALPLWRHRSRQAT